MNRNKSFVVLTLLLLLAISFGTVAQDDVTEIDFYYPTAVGGPLAEIFDAYAADFNEQNPDIRVVPTYAGGYDDIAAAVQTEILGTGEGPDMAVMLSIDLQTFIDNGFIVPVQPFIDEMPEEERDAFVNDFFPAFMANSVDEEGTIWSLPFQRSTPVLYYNKDMFEEAGLDPEHPPANREELVEFGQKLTNDDVWGLLIPSDGFPYWLFQSFPIGNGQNVVGESASEVFYNSPEVVSALEDFIALADEYAIMPDGIIAWGDTPTDFTSGNAAMIYHTTGSLTNILRNADFEVGVGFLPAGDVDYGTPTGGGNIYIFSTSTPEKQEAAWRFAQYLTSPEAQAIWTIGTGYIAARESAWETEELMDLVDELPQYGVARDQLQYAAKELTSHQGLDVRAILNQAISRAILGDMTPQEALDIAQEEADAILSQYRDE